MTGLPYIEQRLLLGGHDSPPVGQLPHAMTGSGGVALPIAHAAAKVASPRPVRTVAIARSYQTRSRGDRGAPLVSRRAAAAPRSCAAYSRCCCATATRARP